MNHQPFETWIFTDDPLQSEDQKKLTEHLQACEDCRGLSLAMEGVHQTFSSASTPAPAPGFARRWQERLVVHRKQLQQKRMWILTLGMFSLASLLSLVLMLLHLGQVNWFYEISLFIANFSRAAARVNQVWLVFQSINNALPILAPIMIVFGVGSLSAALALIVTWFSSMVQLYQPVD